MNRHWYLAGPFFNEPQLDLIKTIEQLMAERGEHCFSPRRDAGNPEGGPKTKEQADLIFGNDMDGLMRATHVLAVIDWKMPEGTEIWPVSFSGTLGHETVERRGRRPLNIPDSGTVFEMGAAAVKRLLCKESLRMFVGDVVSSSRKMCESLEKLQGVVPPTLRTQVSELANWASSVQSLIAPPTILVYTERGADEGVNLMLTSSANGVIYGMDKLRQLLSGKEDLDYNAASGWKGGFR